MANDLLASLCIKHLNTNLVLVVIHICDTSELFYKGTIVQEMKQSVTDEMLSVFEFDC